MEGMEGKRVIKGLIDFDSRIRVELKGIGRVVLHKCGGVNYVLRK